MTISNATLKEIAADPTLYLSTAELVATRKDPKAKDLDMTLWHKMYQHATTAEFVLGKMLSFFDDKTLAYNEWTQIAPTISVTATTGGLAGMLSLISAMHYYNHTNEMISGFDAQKIGEEAKNFKIEAAVLDEMQATAMAYVANTEKFAAVPTVSSKTVAVSASSNNFMRPLATAKPISTPVTKKTNPTSTMFGQSRPTTLGTNAPTHRPTAPASKPAVTTTAPAAVVNTPAWMPQIVVVDYTHVPSVPHGSFDTVISADPYAGGCTHPDKIHDENIKKSKENIETVKGLIAESEIDFFLSQDEYLFTPGGDGSSGSVDQGNHDKFIVAKTSLVKMRDSLNEQKNYLSRISNPSPTEQALFKNTLALQEEINGYIKRLGVLMALPVE